MEKTRKLFSQRSIAIATFFGGPAAAGYLVKKNYELYGQDENGKKALTVGVVSTLLIFSGLFSLPQHIINVIPNPLIPAIYTGIIYLIVEKIQGQWMKEHKESGGEFYSVWKATGIGAIFMVVLLAVIMGTAFISGDFSHPDFDAATYDKEISRFVENENRALAVFTLDITEQPQLLFNELSHGVVLWKENKDILNGLNLIENLPDELLEQNEKLLT